MRQHPSGPIDYSIDLCCVPRRLLRPTKARLLKAISCPLPVLMPRPTKRGLEAHMISGASLECLAPLCDISCWSGWHGNCTQRRFVSGR